MKKNVGTLIAALCAVFLAAWLYIELPSSGVIVFAAAVVVAIIFTVILLVGKKGGTDSSKVKTAWKAVLDFFWGM